MTWDGGGRLAVLGTALLFGCALAAPSFAVAQSDGLYETQRAQRALRSRSLTIDPQPEGKPIAFIEVAQEDVFVDDELWPVWPNWFHWLTTEGTIRRELLLRQGDPYDGERVEETMRNLRALGIFALVRIVPVKTADPNSVGLLVYTRDLWSLRIETGFAGTSDAARLAAQLIERNFLGRNKIVAARFNLAPWSFSLGELYTDPRVLGGDLTLNQSFDLIFNRASDETEGSMGALSLSRQFRDLRQHWGWTASASYANFIERGPGADYELYRLNAAGNPVACEPGDVDPRCMRSVYRDRTYSASVSGSYRRGEAYKQTYSMGLAFSDLHVAAVEETALRPGQEDDFARLLPKERRQIYPFASYSLWLPDYAVFHNLSTFGKSENVRVGPVLDASVGLPLEAFGSSTNSVRFTGEVGYVLGDGEALGEIAIRTEARLEEGRVVDQRAGTLVRGATPNWFAGRFVALAAWDGRRNDTAQTRITLGGDNGLRGYKSGELHEVNGNRVRGNVEYRSLPLVFEAVHLGGVVFYDVGDVYTAVSAIDLHHGVGAGVRLLFPQFNHTPFRLDFGVPLEREGFSVRLSFGSEQAVPLTAADDAAVAANASAL